jgi:hypothetical protein
LIQFLGIYLIKKTAKFNMENVLIIDKFGNKIWYLNGLHHREDGPAIEYASGDKCWYLNGRRHREDGPAIEYVSGSKAWYLNGLPHREDGPAVEYVSGHKEWFLNGQKIHCKDNEEFLRIINLIEFM